jgi:hypothetical protein
MPFDQLALPTVERNRARWKQAGTRLHYQIREARRLSLDVALILRFD